MKIIDKYFTKQLAAIFIMLLLVLTGLAWMLQIMTLMKYLLNYGINLGSFFGLTLLIIPFMLSIIIPFATFIAIIFIYNKMIAENEITVMSATGLSPARIARPAIQLAVIIAIVHWILNIWLTPVSQAKFYDTQWEMRYGLAHMKIQENSFTTISGGLVVYVDKVSGFDLSEVMLSDNRNKKSNLTIFAEKGKLITTSHGLSIVMKNGSLQSQTGALAVGTFDSFDMDLSIGDRGSDTAFKTRRISTPDLLKSERTEKDAEQHSLIIKEISSRFLGPVMDLILAGLCVLVLFSAPLIRRRASFAPAIAIAGMAGAMTLFMSASNMITNMHELILLALGQLLILTAILIALFKK